MSMYLSLFAGCMYLSASSCVVAAATSSASVSCVVALSARGSSVENRLSCMLMYAANLYFHSSCSSFHGMLVALASACVARPGFNLVCVCCGDAAIACAASPPRLVGWDQALYLCSCCCLGCTQMLCLLELPWMFPGSLLRYHEKIQGSCCHTVVLRQLCTLLYCWALLSQLRLKACWSKMLPWTCSTNRTVHAVLDSVVLEQYILIYTHI